MVMNKFRQPVAVAPPHASDFLRHAMNGVLNSDRDTPFFEKLLGAWRA
jgi:hypothetical protein